MITVEDFSNKRLFSYLFVIAISVYGIGFSFFSFWFSWPSLHSAFELSATILACFAGVLSLLRYYSQKDKRFLFIGAAFLGVFALDLFHTIATHEIFINQFPLTPHFVQWTWFSSRLFLSLMFLGSYFALNKKPGHLFQSDPIIYGFTFLFTIASVIIFSLLKLPDLSFTTILLARPEEIIPGFLFLLAFILYFRGQNWKHSYFEYFFVFSLLLNAISQFALLFSFSLYDAHFDVAHIFKLFGYLVVLLGLLIEIYHIYKNSQNNEQELDHIIQSSGDGILVLDDEKKVILFNKSAEKITGFTERELKGIEYSQKLKFKIIDPKRNKPDRFIENVYKHASTEHMDDRTVLITKDGSELPVSDSAAPILKADGTVDGVVVIFKDATKQREIRQMKTDFVSIASHQLRTPLTAIRWGVEMLQDLDSKSLSSEQKDHLQDIYDSSGRMIDLVTALLNVSRLESGRIRIDSKPTNLVKLIESVIKDAKPYAAAKNCKISFKKPKKSPEVPIDEVMFSQVVNNLVTNGIKYTLGGDCRVEITLEKNKDSYLLAVKDNGMGIPKGDKDKIFEKFFRSVNAMTASPGGNGLGLYIARMIMQTGGGDLWFESEEGKGTTFYATLPLKGMKSRRGNKALAIANQ